MDNLCISNERNATGATGGAETTYSSGAPDFTPVFNGVRVDQSLVACVVHCRSLFVLFYFIVWPWYCLSFSTLSFDHGIVCPFLLYRLTMVLFVLFYFIVWPWYCLSFFDLHLLITHFITSNFSLIRFGHFCAMKCSSSTDMWAKEDQF